MRAKHQGNPHSMAAWASIIPTLAQRQQDVLHVMRSRASVTPKEAAAIMGVELNTVSGRFSELGSLGLAFKTGERRDGSGAWAAVLQPRQMMLGEMRKQA